MAPFVVNMFSHYYCEKCLPIHLKHHEFLSSSGWFLLCVSKNDKITPKMKLDIKKQQISRKNREEEEEDEYCSQLDSNNALLLNFFALYQ